MLAVGLYPSLGLSLIETKKLEPHVVSEKYDNYFGDPDRIAGVFVNSPYNGTWFCDVKFWQTTKASNRHTTFTPRFIRFPINNIPFGNTVKCSTDNREVTARIFNKEKLVKTFTWRFDSEGRWVR